MRRNLVLGAFAGLALLSSIGPAGAQWSGCGMGAHGAMVTGHVEAGGPLGLAAQGQSVGLGLNCDYKVNAFVLGGFAEYDWLLGNIEKAAVSNDLTIGGRVGVLINPQSLLYLHAGWSRLDTVAIPLPGGGTKNEIDGVKLGIGNEFRVPNSPIYLDIRYSYGMYDVKDLSPTLDANTHTFRMGLNLKFGPGAFGERGSIFDLRDDPAPVKARDPKLSHPEKKQ